MLGGTNVAISAVRSVELEFCPRRFFLLPFSMRPASHFRPRGLILEAPRVGIACLP